jgi:hypothetical protein
VALHPVPDIGLRRLRQIPVFLYFSTDTRALHVYVRFRTDDFPVIGSVDRMAYCSASHIVHGWCAFQFNRCVDVLSPIPDRRGCHLCCTIMSRPVVLRRLASGSFC